MPAGGDEVGDKWSAAYERWYRGPARSFKQAHERYLAARDRNAVERARRLAPIRRKDKKDV